MHLTAMPGNSPEYRRANPTYAERNRVLNALRDKAKTELARRHAEEFADIFDEMKRKAGIDGSDRRIDRG